MTTRGDRRDRGDRSDSGFQERVVNIKRVSKVVKGGRNFSFNAMVVVGDGLGQVGMGLGKADEVPEAVRKGTSIAKRNMVKVCIKGSTIPHEVTVRFGSSVVMLKPAAPGTGLIAGASVRAVVGSVGIRDILTKSLGSPNPINVVTATFKALESLRFPEETVRERKELAAALLASPPPEPRSPRPPRPAPPRPRPMRDDSARAAAPIAAMPTPAVEPAAVVVEPSAAAAPALAPDPTLAAAPAPEPAAAVPPAPEVAEPAREDGNAN